MEEELNPLDMCEKRMGREIPHAGAKY